MGDQRIGSALGRSHNLGEMGASIESKPPEEGQFGSVGSVIPGRNRETKLDLRLSCSRVGGLGELCCARAQYDPTEPPRWQARRRV